MQPAFLDGDRARSDGVEQRPVVGHEQKRAVECAQCILQRLPALEVQVVGGLVEDQDVRAGGDEGRQREPPQLPAREDRHLLLCLRAREEEPSQQRAGLVRSQPGPTLSGLEHRALATDLLGVLGQEAELDVVAASQLAVAQREPAGQRLDQRGLAGAVGADQGHVLAPLEPQLGAFEQLALARGDRRSLELQRDAPAARGLLELEPRRTARAAVVLQTVDLRQLLHARLGLAGACSRTEARHEPFQALDFRLLALDGPLRCQLACRLLLAPGVPRAGEEARPPRLQLEDRGADRLQEPAVVRDQDDRRIRAW